MRYYEHFNHPKPLSWRVARAYFFRHKCAVERIFHRLDVHNAEECAGEFPSLGTAQFRTKVLNLGENVPARPFTMLFSFHARKACARRASCSVGQLPNRNRNKENVALRHRYFFCAAGHQHLAQSFPSCDGVAMAFTTHQDLCASRSCAATAQRSRRWEAPNSRCLVLCSDVRCFLYWRRRLVPSTTWEDLGAFCVCAGR